MKHWVADGRTVITPAGYPVLNGMCFDVSAKSRSNETRFATWTEFDLEKAIWTIPGERMKARETHIVPLSPQVVALLRRRWDDRTSDDGLGFSIGGKRRASTMAGLALTGGVQVFRQARTELRTVAV